MQFVLFTKHLQGLDLSEMAEAILSVGLQGADLCVRPGFPVEPDTVKEGLPRGVELFQEKKLAIPLVTTPGDFVDPEMPYAEALYEACGHCGVRHIKLGYWNWDPSQSYWRRVEEIRGQIEGFQKLSQTYKVQTVLHTHSGAFFGLNASAAMHLVQGFDPSHVGVFADPGHLSLCGEPIDMALDILGEYLALVSFKDLIKERTFEKGRAVSKKRVARLGHGFGDWSTFLKALRERDYQGVVSFHSEYSGEPVETVIDLTRADVRFIRGILKEIS